MMPAREIADSSPQPRPAAAAVAAKPRPRWLFAVVILVLAGAGLFVWRGFAATSGPDGVLTLSGRIEGDSALVAAKAAGRLLEIRVREGDIVKAGDVIAVLDDDQVRAREDQARAALAQAEARAGAAEAQVAVLQQQLRQSQLQTEQSKVDSAGRVQQAEADLAGARRSLRSRRPSISSRCSTRTRTSGSLNRGRCRSGKASRRSRPPISRPRRSPPHDGSRPPRARSRRRRPISRIRRSTPPARRRSRSSSRSRAGSRQGESADRAGARRAGRGAGQPRGPDGPRAVRRHRRHASGEPGEVVMAGTPIVTLVDLGKVYLRGFVPEGRDRPGQGRPAGACLPRLQSERADRGGGLAHRSAGDVHAREHLLPRGSRQAGRRREAAAQGRRRLRQARHAGRRRDPRVGGELAEGGRIDDAAASDRPAPVDVRPASTASRRSVSWTCEALRRDRGGPRHRPSTIQRRRDLRADRSGRRRQDVDVPDSRRRDGSDVGRRRGVRPAGARGARRRPAT